MADKIVVRKHRGSHGELTACCFLLESGYEVFRNVSSVGPIDIVAIRGDEVLKIDVKQCAPSPSGIAAAGGALKEAQIKAGIIPLFVTEEGFCHFDKRAVADYFADLENRYHQAIFGKPSPPRPQRDPLGRFPAQRARRDTSGGGRFRAALRGAK